MDSGLEKLRSIKSFPSLLKYLRDELEWPIESDDVEDLTFEYEPDELGIDPKTAVKIKEIKQLRPLASNQPWGIFYLGFEPKQLPIVALRRILRALVIKKRASDNQSQMATWQLNDLLFISAYGESEQRQITFAHFSENSGLGDLPTLKVLGWNNDNTVLRLDDTHRTLKERLHWPKDEANADEWRERWSAAFKLQYRETVRTSKELSIRLADLAIVIRKRANNVLAIESKKGELRKLYNAFQEALIHDLTEDDFADMYAQTIAYGLLSARISRPAGLVADNLADMVPVTNPFLKELLQTFLTVGGRKSKIDFDELGINEIVELLRAANMEEVLKDFGARNPNEDPVIHFYELFLKEYDPEKRMKRGVFYTPKPVVSFIVRSVHEILQKEFGLADGLADTTTWGEFVQRSVQSPRFSVSSASEARREQTEVCTLNIPEGVSPDAPFVQILDPATGTGTFLVEVINVIHDTLQQKWTKEGKSKAQQIEAWNEYVPKNLLPRLYGFELMMAPYSIAHMKIGLKLRETHYHFLSSERAQIYLTNTLEEPKDFFDYFATMSPALAHEAAAANRVKRQTPITVVIGNPPYSGHSENVGEWIMSLLRGKDTMTNEATGNYFEVDGHPLGERNPKWLNDDYVKFIRYSQRINERVKVGLLAFISNNGYLDNPTFRGMRQSLTETYNKIYLLDLHGSAKKKEKHPDGSKDENVFDIEQGVGIGTFVSSPNKETAQISHAHLFGVREVSNESNGKIGKYQWLLKNEIEIAEWTEIESQNPFYLFIPQDATLFSEFQNGWKITRMMPTNVLGFQTHRDHFAIDFDKKNLRKRIQDLYEVELSNNEIRKLYGLTDSSSWTVSKARKELRENKDWQKDLIQCSYRPFDNRFGYYSTVAMDRPRGELIDHVVGKDNLCLLSSRQQATLGYQHSWVAKKPANDCVVSTTSREANQVFPLYLYPTEKEKALGATGRVPNFSKEFIGEFSNQLGLEFKYEVGTLNDEVKTNSSLHFSPEDVFAYAYAVFHSPTYRSRYAEFLKIDFPRLPLTSDTELFRKLCTLGAELVALHLLESVDALPAFHPSATADGTDKTVAAGFPKYEGGKVLINKTTWFDGVPAEVWNFHIGGYQVCHKWLKDRKGRTLSAEDIAHYGKITVALEATIRLMAEIDEVIEEHGGFPLTGSQTRATPETGAGGKLTLPFA